jgi:outer membrane protein insertion porin family
MINGGMRKLIVTLILFLVYSDLFAFTNNDSVSIPFLDYARSKEYTIADISVTGVKYLQPSHLISISGLAKGMTIKIPGPELSDAIRKYWKHGLFSDVKILVTKIEGDQAFLEIQLREQPRMNQLEISGINKSEQEDINEKINLKRGTQITEDILNSTSTIIKRHFREKGFLNVGTDLKYEDDTANQNMVNLYIRVNKSNRVKIDEIIFVGNEDFTARRLRRTMKKTKQIDLNIFKGSKLNDLDYKEDKKKLVEFYNENGYRDAKILDEKITNLNAKRIKLELTLNEGNQYHIRSLNWIGNTKYETDYLNTVLGMKPGEIYDQKLLNERISSDEDAVTSVYMDNGYLFFSINPVESRVENDSVDLEMRIYEGKQATLSDILITGNTKTNEHVVRRELYTRPGELFSRSDIIRSVRELAALGHFNPETISPNPLPNPADGSVDIEYSLEERANDQLELSGGWGGSYGFMGTVGIRFSNFSMRNFFNDKAWRPVPSGDGQTLQIRAQSTGKRFQSYNISFIEPWFGGKKPNSFSLSVFYSKSRYSSNSSSSYSTYEYNTYNENDPYIITIGTSAGIGKRLKWPDDYFTLYNEVSYQQYRLHNYFMDVVREGNYNLFSLKTVLARSSQDQMIFPRRGSSLSLSLRITPPYSLFSDRNFANIEPEERYKNVEFHKWDFSGSWYNTLIQNLVLALHAEFGYLGHFNKDIGAAIFERYEVGGSGLAGYDITGTDIIALRGYEDGGSVSNLGQNSSGYSNLGANLYNRFFAEIRYPFSLNPSATIYGLAFIEGGNAWLEWKDFNPLAVKRAAGIGVRAFLPMFGMLGVDWAYGFDPSNAVPGEKSGPQWHFFLGQQF